MTEEDFVSGPDQAPVFPLPLVLTPGGYINLRIFEVRYLDMVSTCTREGSPLCICNSAPIKKGEKNVVSRTGCLAEIVDWSVLEDGLLGITVLGLERIKIDKTTVKDNGLIIGDYIRWPLLIRGTDMPPVFDFLVDMLRSLLTTSKSLPFEWQESQLEDGAWVSHRLADFLPLDVKQRQELLEKEDLGGRFRILLNALQDVTEPD